ncbi:bifunctional precorrin-2 dehydrogenase/sirohydrochlorin ferrochelatase [Paenibacillus albidus]|uniref:precorrin-2 dehydrogenase/sirohydrochlorin ferrochelatase family protein n=1 Tax=Paenibacillus albidus TaxID=2041023 RepID=UPI001BEB5CAA|nr:NAD(P)-dependent oxidoreductase [Paenibacillus albidus]MBT2290523.1 bifunctional precorrin-2 dehydrogenase/sirohydrochlorin ferrochelatase [Paenibacillus albidus]
MSRYLPIMLECAGQPCIVIGGGAVAERKIMGLLEAGAAILVISPELSPRLTALAQNQSLKWLKRLFAPGDTRGAFLVYAASSDAAVNMEVAREARKLNIPVNVASEAEAGSFITPGVLRRGRLTVAVSTSGAGPAAAAQIKGLLEEMLGGEYEPYLDFLYDMRTEIKRRKFSAAVRGRLLRKLAALDVLDEIRQGTFKKWGPEVIETWIADNREE